MLLAGSVCIEICVKRLDNERLLGKLPLPIHGEVARSAGGAESATCSVNPIGLPRGPD